MKFEDLNSRIDLSGDEEYYPLWSTDIGPVSLFVWRKPELKLETLETYPYQLDGSMPMIFAQAAWFELIFEWPWLYKIIYKRKYGYLPDFFRKD